MAARYTHHYGPFGEQVLQAGWMVAIMHTKAEAIQAAAIAMSPVRTGEYKASFVVESGVRHGRTSRAYGRVTNTSRHAMAVEYGWGPTPKYRILGKAAGIA